MRPGTVELLLLLFVLATIVAGIFVYPAMPDRMPSHWDASGNVNGYVSRPVGVFLIPGIAVLLYLLYLAIPRIDPLKANIAQFRGSYDLFYAFLLLFLASIYVHTLLWSSGIQLNTSLVVGIGVGSLIYLTGHLCTKAKRNYFIGIRTPWTLSSDSVWDKTHKLGGVAFRIAGTLVLIGSLVPQFMLWSVLISVLTATFIVVIYSYVVYEREQQDKQIS